jgi:hypothetical protein
VANKYIRRIFINAAQETRQQVFVSHKLIPALFTAPLAALFLWFIFQRHQAMPNVLKLLISIGLAYATIVVLIFFWSFLMAFPRLDKKEREEHEKAEREASVLRQEKASREADVPRLAIRLDKKYQTQCSPSSDQKRCGIAVQNISQQKSALNVELWIVDVTPRKLQKDTLPSRSNRKISYFNFRADKLDPQAEELFDIFQWGLHSNVSLCIEEPHGADFKLKDFPGMECELKLEARANDVQTVTKRFKLRWKGQQLEFASVGDGVG